MPSQPISVGFKPNILVIKRAYLEVQARDNKVEIPSPSTLHTRRQQKALMFEGAAKFNKNPKEGIKFMQGKPFMLHVNCEMCLSLDIESGILPVPCDPTSLAKFLKSTPKLSKKWIGEYLGRPDNVQVLKQFIGLFDFRGVRHSD